ncbi:MAG: hypothetical protein MUE63_00110 [Xanthomonadales bacterium]|jgi:hypothetical protein|nr:hypothetical protein [Xanthomonadales bacterium]
MQKQSLPPAKADHLPAASGGSAHVPLKSYSVKITLANGQRIAYRALAGSSVAALQAALDAHGITRIVIHSTGRMK